MHPDLMAQMVRQDIAERIREVERERVARLAGNGHGPSLAERLDESLRRTLIRRQASRGERCTTPRQDASVDRPCL